MFLTIIYKRVGLGGMSSLYFRYAYNREDSHVTLYFILSLIILSSFTIKSCILYIMLLWPSGDLKTHAHLTGTRHFINQVFQTTRFIARILFTGLGFRRAAVEKYNITLYKIHKTRNIKTIIKVFIIIIFIYYYRY